MKLRASTDANTAHGAGPASRTESLPVSVLVEVVLKPEHEVDSLAELRDAARRWEGEPGCSGVTVLRDTANPARLMVLEEFTSADALEYHESLDTTREVLARMADHLAGPPVRSIFHKTGSRGSRSTISGAAWSPSEINVRWAEMLNAGDVEGMLDLYEPDAVVVPGPGVPAISGLPAIRRSLDWLATSGGTITFQPRYWLQQGDLALGSIAFRLAGGRDGDGNAIDFDGTTSEVARRQDDGSWRYVFDHPFSGVLD